MGMMSFHQNPRDRHGPRIIDISTDKKGVARDLPVVLQRLGGTRASLLCRRDRRVIQWP